MPVELLRCVLLDKVATRYGRLPSEVLDADISNFLVFSTVMSAQCESCGQVHAGGCRGGY